MTGIERRDRAATFDLPLGRRAFVAGGLLAITGTTIACTPTTPPAPPTPTSSSAATGSPAPSGTGWRTVWEDDFASGLDPAVWTPADHGGNRDLGERQYNDPSMVTIDGENLALRARPGGRDGYDYLAGSVSTKGKLTVGPHGRLTTRQLLGPGVGLGFAVALYGENIDAVGWPACGEIDATEIALARPTSPFASLHGPGYSGGEPISTTGQVPSLIDRWAEHTLEWTPERITWSIDGQTYHTVDATDARARDGWPFDQPFFITIVLTIGSSLSGPVDEATWPTEDGERHEPYAVVDFIRFEQKL